MCNKQNEKFRSRAWTDDKAGSKEFWIDVVGTFALGSLFMLSICLYLIY